jgi:hypothetical protein
MYKHHGHCLYCQTEAESKMWKEGTYHDWVTENVEKNFSKWKSDKRKLFNEWLKNINSKKNITESGLIEDWSEISETVKEDIIKRFNDYILEEENKMKNLIKEENK